MRFGGTNTDDLEARVEALEKAMRRLVPALYQPGSPVRRWLETCVTPTGHVGVTELFEALRPFATDPTMTR